MAVAQLPDNDRGDELRDRGRPADALAAYASGVDPAQVGVDELVAVLARLGLSTDDTRRVVDEVAARPSVDATVHALRGLVLLEAGDPGAALAALEGSTPGAPDPPVFADLRGAAAVVAGRRREVLAGLPPTSGGDRAVRLERIARVLTVTGHPSEALDMIEEAGQADPSDPRYAVDRVGALVALDQLPDAPDRLPEALAAANALPDEVFSPAQLGGLAERLLARDRAPDAAVQYLRMARRDPDAFNWPFLIGLFQRVGRLDDLGGLDHEVPVAQAAYFENLLGDAMKADGRPDDAAHWYGAAVARQPTEEYFYNDVVNAAVAAGRLDAVTDLAAQVAEPARGRLLALRNVQLAWRTGDEHRDAGRLPEALAAYSGPLDPTHIDLSDLNSVLGRLGRPDDEAVAALGQAVAGRPDDPVLRALHGLLLLQANEVVEAQADFDAALVWAPDSELLVELRGAALVLAGRPTQAMAPLNGRDDSARASALNMMGVVLGESHPRTALDLFAEASRLAPAETIYASNRVRSLFLLGRLDDAVALADSLADWAVSTQRLSALAEALENAGRPGDAIRQYLRASRQDPQAFDWTVLPRVYRTAHRLDEAVEMVGQVPADYITRYENVMGDAFKADQRRDEAAAWYRQAVERQPTADYFYADLAQTLAELDRLGEAVDLMSGLPEPVQTSLADAVSRAASTQLGEGGRAESAEAVLDRVVELVPDFALGWYVAGLARSERQHFTEAEKAMNEAIRLDPAESLYRFGLGQFLSERGRFEEAEAAVRQALAGSDDTGYRLFLAEMLRGLGRTTEAEVEYRRLAQQTPAETVADTHTWAFAHYRLGDLDVAVKGFRDTLAFDPTSVEAQLNLAIALFESHDWSGAEAGFRSVLAAEPERWGAYGNLGASLANLERYDEAIESFVVAVDRDGTDVEDHLRLGRLLRLEGDRHEDVDRRSAALNESIRRLGVARGLFPDSVDIALQQGLALAQADRHNEACTALRRVDGSKLKYPQLEPQGDGAALQFILGREFVLAAQVDGVTADDRIAQFERAVTCLKKASELKYPGGRAQLYLGQTHAHLEQWSEAEPPLTEAAADPDADIRIDAAERLSLVYLQLADKTGAHDFYDDVVDQASEALATISKVAIPAGTAKKPLLYFRRGYARCRLGMIGDARKDFREAKNAAPPGSALSLAAERNLRRIEKDRALKVPGWLPPAVFVIGVAVVVVSFVFVGLHRLSGTALAPVILAALALVVAGYYLPVLTRLKLGSVELEKQVAGSDVSQLSLMSFNETDSLGTDWIVTQKVSLGGFVVAPDRQLAKATEPAETTDTADTDSTRPIRPDNTAPRGTTGGESSPTSPEKPDTPGW